MKPIKPRSKFRTGIELAILLVFIVIGLMMIIPIIPFFTAPKLNLPFNEFERNLTEARYYQKLSGNFVQCNLCFRRCTIPDGGRGYCGVRENRKGILYTLVYGKPSAVHVDPIEKEPLHHFLPGGRILCIGTAGCNFKCSFCHNWHLAASLPEEIRKYDLPPEKIVEMALEHEVEAISFTYNEPTIFYEYMYDVSKLAKEKGLRVVFHTNGAMNSEPLRELLKYVDAVTVDLKAFTAEFYKVTSFSKLEPVLNTLKILKEEGVWFEIVNLVIPTQNDDMENIREMCIWIKDNLGGDVPVHFSRFSPAYKLTMLPPTPVETLEDARKICLDSGMNYVNIGNVPGHEANSLFCPKCGKKLIHRIHFTVLGNNLKDGKCPSCGHEIPGVWK